MTRSPGSRLISRGGYTYVLLNTMNNCIRRTGVTLSITSQRLSLVVQVTPVNRLNVLSTLEDPVEFWDTLKYKTLQAAKKTIGERPRSKNGSVSETQENIAESSAATLAAKQERYSALSRKTRALLGRDKERYEANDFKTAYLAIKNPCSKPAFLMSATESNIF